MKIDARHVTKTGRVTPAGALLVAASLALLACASPDSELPPPPVAAASSEPEPVAPVVASSADEAEPPPPPCDEAKMAAIQASFADTAIPAAAGGVAIVKDRSCGTRYFTRGVSKDVPRDALHLIGSATKTYIASLTLLLADDGRLKLSDPIDKWLKGVPAGDKITIEDLLHHTSGLYNYSSNWVYQLGSWFKSAYRPGELLNFSFTNPMTFAPGAPDRWEYSNTNYVLLGLLIEAVTGKPVAEVLRERILGPIGAKATFYYGGEPLKGSFAPAVTFMGTPGAGFMHPSAVWACGNMVSTIDDYADWTEKRGNGTFHSARRQAELVKGAPTGLDLSYGAALVMVGEGVRPLNGNGPAIGHGGDIPGYHTVSYYFPHKKATITMVMHGDQGPGGATFFGATYSEALYQTLVDPYFGTTPAKK